MLHSSEDILIPEDGVVPLPIDLRSSRIRTVAQCLAAMAVSPARAAIMVQAYCAASLLNNNSSASLIVDELCSAVKPVLMEDDNKNFLLKRAVVSAHPLDGEEDVWIGQGDLTRNPNPNPNPNRIPQVTLRAH